MPCLLLGVKGQLQTLHTWARRILLTEVKFFIELGVSKLPFGFSYVVISSALMAMVGRFF